MMLWIWILGGVALLVLFCLEFTYALVGLTILIVLVLLTPAIMMGGAGDQEAKAAYALTTIYWEVGLYIAIGYVVAIIRRLDGEEPSPDDVYHPAASSGSGHDTVFARNPLFDTNSEEHEIHRKHPATKSSATSELSATLVRTFLPQLRQGVIDIFTAIPVSRLFETWDADVCRITANTACAVGQLTLLHADIYKACSSRDLSIEQYLAELREQVRNLSRSPAIPEFITRTAGLSSLPIETISMLITFCTTITYFAALAAGATTKGAQLRRLLYEAELREFEAQHKSGRNRGGSAVAESELYALLGVEPGVSPAGLKAAYHRKVREWHPDQLEHMAPELRSFATEQLARINVAYEQLSRGD